MHIAPLLISAAAGYLVLERAERQRNRIKTVGRIVGWLIVIASFAGVLCRVCYIAKGPMAGKVACPFMGAPKPPPPSP